MASIRKNQNGFSLGEILIAIVVIGALGMTGAVVYDKQKPDKPATDASQTEDTLKTETATETTDAEAQGWTTVTSAQKGFGIRIPDGWAVTNYGESDNVRANKLTYVAGTKATVETLDTAYAGDSLVRFQVVQFTDSDDYRLLDGDETKTPFAAGKLQGTKYTKTYPLEEIQGVGPLPGEEMYVYEFKTTGKTTYVIYRVLNKNQYTAEFLSTNYNQSQSDPNQVALVERAVKTLAID